MAPLAEQVVGVAALPADQRASYADAAQIAALVRDAMRQCGLGVTDADAPLRDIIAPGQTVLLKPNWVLHFNKGGHGMDCMVTHPTIIEAVLAEVVKARPAAITIGDAPIQSSHFDALVPAAWRAKLHAMAGSIPLHCVDFRRNIWEAHGLRPRLVPSQRSPADYLLFDLGRTSLLEPVSAPAGKFRNTCYDHRALEQSHRPGCHKYLVAREVFCSDVIINLPKLKTHRKAGLTGALKNLVGINGDKDYLPHHRVGGSARGGDCYAGDFPLKSAAEAVVDVANQHVGGLSYRPLSRVAWALAGANRLLHGDAHLDGAWPGNDTVWRMVLDLNRVALYGTAAGLLVEQPVRRVFSLTDAVIAGEGYGPLAPEPVGLGVVTFASSSAFADLAHTALMRFDWRKLATVRQAFAPCQQPLTAADPAQLELRAAGRSLSLAELAWELGADFRAPALWRGQIEQGRHT